jgi:hypothetical protein
MRKEQPIPEISLETHSLDLVAVRMRLIWALGTMLATTAIRQHHLIVRDVLRRDNQLLRYSTQVSIQRLCFLVPFIIVQFLVLLPSRDLNVVAQDLKSVEAYLQNR